ncbi:unnamed protein product, partial [Urochloa humidicola]
AGVQEEDASQPLHLRAWEDICRDKAQGGLGIKRIDLEIQRIITTLWYLWKARNDQRFNKKDWKISNVLFAVKADIHATHIINQDTHSYPPATPQLISTGAPHTNRTAIPHTNITMSAHHNTNALFTGTTCFVDAAITPDAQVSNPRQAGLGILIQGGESTTIKQIFIQAVTDSTLNPLHAETVAITLASAIISTLRLNQVRYFTDSKLLASTLQSQDPVTQAKDWRTRSLIADFLSNSQEANYTVNKIPRQRNSTAHSLAV